MTQQTTPAAAVAERKEWLTPVGTLVLSDDGSIQATVRYGRADGAASMTAPPAFSALGSPFFLEFSDFQQQTDHLALYWKPHGVRVTPLTAIATEWRREPAVHLPEAIQLVQTIGRACRELDHLRPLRFLFSPAQVLLSIGEDGLRHWAFVPVPLNAATYADFATSSPDVLAWTAADEVLSIGQPDWGYLMASALHYCLVGESFPAHLPRNERIRRLLLSRAGNPALTKAVLMAALPRAMAATGAALGEFVSSLLGPIHGRLIPPTRIARDFDRLQEDLAPTRLAAAWEAERNYHRAVAILNTFAQTGPAEQVPWETLARLRDLTGDAAGATKIRTTILPAKAGEPELLIAKVRAIVARGPEGRPALEEAVLQLQTAEQAARPLRAGLQSTQSSTSTPHAGLSDEEFLYLVYVNGRWLGHLDESIQLLTRDFPVTWYNVVKLIVTARLLVEKQAWTEVSWNCREARRIIEKMPGHAGANGQYTLAYSDMLDGIAHLRAVENGLPSAYLSDGLVRLENAWIGLREFSPDELEPCLAGWLTAITRKLAAYPELALFSLGAEAFCQSLGKPGESAMPEPLSVPWFAEEHLFST
jgi:hypothetical protein